MSAPLLAPKRRAAVTGRAVVLLLVLGALVFTLAVPVRSWLAQRADIASLQAQVDAAEQRVADLTIQEQRWADPAFIAAEARRRLHFVLPGEIGYTTLGADGRPAAESLADAAAHRTWVDKMWATLQQADNGAPEAGATTVTPGATGGL
ncbi:MAG: septum formation initiator family protein [Actinomycetota bacterium]|nr:septum formation initiator family protein [Actinomycetota bacterium]